jgi:MoaA/NifB/PqqE/SkfB family radical SAM enzyme
MLVVFSVSKEKNYREKQEMETVEWKRILKDLAENKCFWVIFSGGEPLIRKDFWELLEFARKNKFVVSIVSNGILLEKKDILKFKKYYIESITISLHAIDKKLCREIYGIEYFNCRLAQIFKEVWEEKYGGDANS